ncbi:unnamed protein product [Pleuronectes platessa]|uniref:Uncharacterized protein n=1 Tax=Pleuronectes platessa TaxID=8262 RepID=A0A9N7U9D9_PLEPL|nr:unnamed protein product [Pleuronectes platessa]
MTWWSVEIAGTVHVHTEFWGFGLARVKKSPHHDTGQRRSRLIFSVPLDRSDGITAARARLEGTGRITQGGHAGGLVMDFGNRDKERQEWFINVRVTYPAIGKLNVGFQRFKIMTLICSICALTTDDKAREESGNIRGVGALWTGCGFLCLHTAPPRAPAPAQLRNTKTGSVTL